MPINDNPNLITVAATTQTPGIRFDPYPFGAALPVPYTINVPVSYVPMPVCTCNYTWGMSASGATESVRRPSLTCPQHAEARVAASEHACPTCGR